MCIVRLCVLAVCVYERLCVWAFVRGRLSVLALSAWAFECVVVIVSRH